MIWEALQILNSLYLFTLVASFLSFLTLRILTGSAPQQIDLIGEYRNSVDQATRNCLNARAVALSLESNAGTTLRLVRIGNVVSIRDPSLLLRTSIEEADQLMRTLSALPKRCGEMRITQIRRNLRTLRYVERESVKLLEKLESAKQWCVE